MRRVLEITTELSKACAAWLAPAAEGLWRSLCVGRLRRRAGFELFNTLQGRVSFIRGFEDRGLVVEVGMGCIRAGAATGAPHYIPLYYDTVRSTLDLEKAPHLYRRRPSRARRSYSRTRLS